VALVTLVVSATLAFVTYRALRIERAATPQELLWTLVIHGDEERPVTDLLASHPPMDDRIDRLRRRARDGAQGRGREPPRGRRR